jgi:hypothetical protein
MNLPLWGTYFGLREHHSPGCKTPFNMLAGAIALATAIDSCEEFNFHLRLTPKLSP